MVRAAGCEHLWKSATYDLDVPKDWFVKIAPYAILVVRTLRLVVPPAGGLPSPPCPLPSETTCRRAPRSCRLS
jgi:hypothetical protein